MPIPHRVFGSPLTSTTPLPGNVCPMGQRCNRVATQANCHAGCWNLKQARLWLNFRDRSGQALAGERAARCAEERVLVYSTNTEQGSSCDHRAILTVPCGHCK